MSAASLQEWDKLWTFNKKAIDPVCPRHTAVITQGRVLLRLTDVTAPDYVTVDRHKKFPGAGKKTTLRSGVRHSEAVTGAHFLGLAGLAICSQHWSDPCPELPLPVCLA